MRNLFLVIFISCFIGAKAQTDKLDFSFLKFGDVQKYYQSKNIELLNCWTPDLFFEGFTWLGVPYRLGGKSKEGIDCSALVAQIYNKIFGKNLSGAVRDIYAKCTDISKEELSEGDLVIFSIRAPYSHIGIYLQNNKFLHATVSGGVMINDLNDSYYQRYFLKGARLIQ